MKNQKNIYLILAILLWSIHGLNAQSGIFQFEGKHHDYTVPANTKAEYIYLSAVGGDGGVDVATTITGTFRKKGGTGAYVGAAFKIGNNSDQIKPRGIIRFIVGHQGDGYEKATQTLSMGMGGGGGTGICYKGPDPNDKWKILLVAGGGAGAYWNPTYKDRRDGEPGKAYSPNYTPTDWNEEDGGGAGVFKMVNFTYGNYSLISHAGWEGGPDNEGPKGGSGWDESEGSTFSGGWGFGAGGIGYKGSGGYIGGGGGYVRSGEGQGGRSYLNKDMEILSFLSYANGTTAYAKNGYAAYAFFNGTLTTIKSERYQTKCLTGNGNDNPGFLEDCDSDNLRQGWVINGSTIRSWGDSRKCLTLTTSIDVAEGDEVHLHPCSGSFNQNWAYDGVTRQIRYVRIPTKCLGLDTKNNYATIIRNCRTGLIQKWNVSGANTFDLGEYQVATIRPMANETKCIDNKGGKIEEGNPIQLSTCVENDNENNQKWFFDGYGIRLSEDRSKCLDVPSTSSGTALRLYYCHATSHGAESHEWIYDGMTNMIRYRDNVNKCLSYKNGDTANGTNIIIEDCDPELDKMKWTLKTATPKPNDAVFGEIKRLSKPGHCLDLKNSSASKGTNIQSWPCNGTQAQGWFVQDKQIKLAKDLGFCLSLTGDAGNDGDNIRLWECKAYPTSQLWIFDITNKFIRRNADPTKCLDVDNSNNIVLNPCDYDNPSSMQWTMPGNYSERLSGNNLSIHLAKNENKCVDMAKNAEDGNLRVYTCEENNSQYFVFDGATIKRANNPGLCVDIESGNMDNGTNIRLWHCNGTDAQKWIYDGVSGRIHSQKDPNKCMRFTQGRTANGTNVKISDCNNDEAEIFIIK